MSIPLKLSQEIAVENFRISRRREKILSLNGVSHLIMHLYDDTLAFYVSLHCCASTGDEKLARRYCKLSQPTGA